MQFFPMTFIIAKAILLQFLQPFLQRNKVVAKAFAFWQEKNYMIFVITIFSNVYYRSKKSDIFFALKMPQIHQSSLTHKPMI